MGKQQLYSKKDRIILTNTQITLLLNDQSIYFDNPVQCEICDKFHSGIGQNTINSILGETSSLCRACFLILYIE